MPKVQKETIPLTGKLISNGIMNRIVSVEKVSKGGLKMSIYGRPKTGKTRLAATFPKPLLILGTEDGTASIRGINGIDFIRVIGNKKDPPKEAGNNFMRLNELDGFLNELIDGKWNTIVLDTASMLQDLIYADIMGLEDAPIMKSPPTSEQNQMYSGRTRSLLRELLRIPRNVVVVSHEKNHSEDQQSSDVMVPLVSSSLSGAVCRYLGGEVDYLCQMFIREKTTAKETTIAGKAKTMEVKTGKAEYCLRIGQHSVYSIGFRHYSKDPNFTLPDVIVDPTYEKITRVIQGEEL